MSLDLFAVLLVLAPFPAAILAPMISRETGRAAGWILAIVPAGLFVALLSLLPIDGPARFSVAWIPSLDLHFGFFIDGLSLVFALLITGIGALILIYSGAYLDGYAHRGRFLAFMLLFMGAMLGLVLADSLVALFAFWELTSVTSFLLIGFDAKREAARRAAIQALLVTGLGGLALMAGGVLLHQATGTWDIDALKDFATAIKTGGAYPWIVVLVLLAAFTKSAQFPFHFWLPNAMEAPTPVSAYLHSATMVQGGVYLLARLNPVLGGPGLWQMSLMGFGGVTLLWAATQSIRQHDLKQMLAQTTIASLGLLVLLIGVGTPIAITAMVLYFVTHALYKAGLFLVVGVIDKEVGAREFGSLGGLRDHMTVAFIATGLAALSMIGLPPFIGYLAKEEMYLGVGPDNWTNIATLATLVIGNALLAAVALALLIRPFFGTFPKREHIPGEGPIAMLAGPVILGLAGAAVVFALAVFGELFVAPMASAISGHHSEAHLAFGFDPTGLPFWLSLATWAAGGLCYWKFDGVRDGLDRLAIGMGGSFDRGFDAMMFGLIRFAGALTRTLHHGRLELYLVMVFAMLALAVLGPLWVFDAWPDWSIWVAASTWTSLNIYEWGVVALGVVGVLLVFVARTRLFAILALGVQGLAVALIFMVFGAPDLAFTQLMIEVLSVVILALVMTRLHLDANDPRPLEDLLRDGALALISASAVSILLLKVVEGDLSPRLSDFFEQNTHAIAHGRNIVNVILVDFRGLDTLGEISVIMGAGIATLALLRHRRHNPPDRGVQS